VLWIERLPWDIINAAATSHGLDRRWIAAIIQKESGGDTWAVRYEPNWKYEFHTLEMAKKSRTTVDTQRQLQKFSYGLMQVMGTVAYELGLRENPMKLCADPERGVLYGCLILARLKKRYPLYEDIFSAYNAGSAIKINNGIRINQLTYVNPVLSLIKELGEAGK